MSVFDFVLLSFAAGALVRAWLHPGGVFADFRDWLDVWLAPDADTLGVPRLQWLLWITEKLSYGLGCGVCMTYHASFWLIVLYGISYVVVAPWDWLLQVPMYVFAVARVSLFIRTCELTLWSYRRGAAIGEI